MEAIGAASAIIGVAQFGIQFSQVLITVIGDYRDAAKNINRLRDEIHLASICLQQLGDLARRDLLREYGMLEATNLRERCQAVFWEIRSKIQKGDDPLHPTTVSKEQIDVTYFTSLKWSLWTKKQLEESRQELDRLKNSMTLCFVSHMAILAGNELERSRYTSQIPGIKKSLDWSAHTPDDNLFRYRLEQAGIAPDKIAQILDEDMPSAQSSEQETTPGIVSVEDSSSSYSEPQLKAWSIDLLATSREIPVTQGWIAEFLKINGIGDSAMWKIHSKLHPWFKNELDCIFRRLEADGALTWSLVFLKPVYKHVIAHGLPKCVQVVMKGTPRGVMQSSSGTAAVVPEAIAYTIEEPIETKVYHMDTTTSEAGFNETPQTTYMQMEPAMSDVVESDEEIIARQLALYE